MPSDPLPQTYRVKSFGCQMNVYDGERMAELLAEQGMRAAADGADADLIVLNTCHIREKAAEKVYSDIGRLRARRRLGKPLIAVAGCVAQAEGAEIIARAPAVDMVVGPQAYHRLPESGRRGGGRDASRSTPTCRRAPSSTRCPPRRARRAERVPDRAGRVRQILHLLRRALHARRRESRGRSPTCSTRRSALVDAGAREITLLGQNVNAWAGEDAKGRAIGLDGLIRALDRDRPGSRASATPPATPTT